MSSFIPRLNSIMTIDDAKQLNSLVLAFVGDGVQTLYVRTKLVNASSSKAGVLHKLVAGEINAVHQSKAVMSLLEIFNTEEMEIYKRARNSKTNSSAKNANIIDYKKASGYEAVIGYLYLTGQSERLDYLLGQGDKV